MIKRDITETVYEYDNEGKLIKKTVIEKHEEEDNAPKLGDILTNPATPSIEPYDWRKYQITCDQCPEATLTTHSTTMSDSTNRTTLHNTDCVCRNN